MNLYDKIWYRRLFDTATDGGAGGGAGGDGGSASTTGSTQQTQQADQQQTQQADQQQTQQTTAPAKPDWREQRMNELTFQRQEEKRLREAAEAENKRIRERLAARGIQIEDDGDAGTATSTTARSDTVASPEDVARIADTLAQSKAATMVFDRQCNDVVMKGKTAYQDFDATLGTLRQTGFTDSREALETVINLPDPEDIVYYLGKNPAKAQELVGMTPVARTVALVKLGEEVKAAKMKPGTGTDGTRTVVATGAPPPVRTLKGGGAATGEVDVYDTKNTSMDDWVKKRDADQAARRAARSGR